MGQDDVAALGLDLARWMYKGKKRNVTYTDTPLVFCANPWLSLSKVNTGHT